MLPRVIFGLALFGILAVTHLWLQKEASFAYGCTGVEELAVTDLEASLAAAAAEPGCAEVTSSAYATFFGVSNLVWGLLFYLAVALLRLGHAATGDDRLRLASLGLVGVGFLYTLYLVYLQAAVLGAFCVLCMTSALTVTLLLILHVMEHLRLRRAAPATPARRTALTFKTLKPFALMAAFFAIVLVADLVVAQQRGGSEAVAETPAGTAAPVNVPQEPATPPPAVSVTDPAAQCRYDPQFAPIADFDRFTDGPYRGSADAAVRVVEFFDPNCPHCKDLHGAVTEAVAMRGDQARFYYVPFPLREQSFGQVAALYVAQEQGRFWELVEAFFDRQDHTWGMSLDEIVEAGQAAGMSGEALRARLEDQTAMQGLLAEIVADRAAASEAIAGADGGVSVPKLAVNGRIVEASYESYSADCLAHFIDEAAGGGAAAP